MYGNSKILISKPNDCCTQIFIIIYQTWMCRFVNNITFHEVPITPTLPLPTYNPIADHVLVTFENILLTGVLVLKLIFFSIHHPIWSCKKLFKCKKFSPIHFINQSYLLDWIVLDYLEYLLKQFKLQQTIKWKITLSWY